MNINKLIKRLKDDLGLSRFVKLSFTDKDIYDIIVNHALEEWSHYFKQSVMFQNVMFTDNLRLEPNLYMIPKNIVDMVQDSGLIIEDIKDYKLLSDDLVMGGANFVSGYLHDLNYSSAYSAGYSMLRQGSAIAFTNLQHACYYEKPNRLRFVFSQPTNDIGLTCNLTLYVSQAKNLSAISETREHDFYELCKYNLMTVLYQNEAKFIESISSGRGNINIKVDEWASAADKKVELLEKLMTYSTISHPAHFLAV